MFEHAELKIGRANKHIAEFNSEVRRFIDENRHTVCVEFDPYLGCDTLQIQAPRNSLPEEIALPIGDAIHNLHTALDFIWYEFVCLFDTPDQYTKFPFRKNGLELAGALNGKKIPAHLQSVQDFILNVVQPYDGSNTRLWEFHNLDITDKHEYLIPQLRFTTVSNIQAEDEDGNPIPLPRTKTFVQGFTSTVYMSTKGRNVKVTNNGEMAANVLFHKGPLRGLDVAKSLHNFSALIVEILEGFRTRIP